MFISFVLNLGSELVGKKWRAVVIWHLRNGALRFSELKRLMSGVSVKVLTEVLKEMCFNELIIRTQFNTIPVKVTYQIHPNAVDFVTANIICTLKIAEYIVKNHKRYDISDKDLKELTAWVNTNTLALDVKAASLVADPPAVSK
jgi:DNA-binding HxlR family transcriptional regulator